MKKGKQSLRNLGSPPSRTYVGGPEGEKKEKEAHKSIKKKR